MTPVELRPPIPFPVANVDVARRDADWLDADLEDWVWAMRLEEELDFALLARDSAAMRRRNLVGRIRVIALFAVAASIVGVVQLATHFGWGLGLVAAWSLPLVVLGVVLGAEQLLLRCSR